MRLGFEVGANVGFPRGMRLAIVGFPEGDNVGFLEGIPFLGGRFFGVGRLVGCFDRRSGLGVGLVVIFFLSVDGIETTTSVGAGAPQTMVTTASDRQMRMAVMITFVLYEDSERRYLVLQSLVLSPNHVL